MVLRRLLVVTGTVNVEKIGKAAPEARTPATVISTSAMRELRWMRVVKTPFGTLIDPARGAEVADLIHRTSVRVNEFNRASAVCKLTNSMLCEPLQGAREAAVSGWLARRLREGARDVLKAQEKLQEAAAA